MRSLIMAAMLLTLASCSFFNSDQTPQQRYYDLNTGVTATAKIVEQLVDTCLTLPADDPCKPLLPDVNKGATAARKALQQVDAVFVKGDSQYYDLSLSVAENALKDLSGLISKFKTATGS